MILQLVAAFFATLSFSFLFNAPRKELLICGISGVFSWLAYLIIMNIYDSVVIATFVATVFVTIICRRFAFVRKMPITVFLIPGIIPLVPGAGIYNTMYNIIINEPIIAALKGIETFKIAGVIAIGIMIVLSMHQKLFHFIIFKNKLL